MCSGVSLTRCADKALLQEVCFCVWVCCDVVCFLEVSALVMGCSRLTSQGVPEEACDGLVSSVFMCLCVCSV